MGQLLNNASMNKNSRQDKPPTANNSLLSYDNELVACNALQFLNVLEDNYNDCNYLKLNNIVLPEEIVLLIFNYLTIKDIYSLSSINSTFNNYWTVHPQIWKIKLQNLSCVNKFTISCCNVNNYKQFYKKIYLPNLNLNHIITKYSFPTKDNYNFKIAIYGDQKIGKTIFLEKFTDDKYKLNENTYSQTIGVDFKRILLSTTNREKGGSVLFWDIGGDKRFEVIAKKFYERANGLIICFDLMNEESFNIVEKSIKEFIIDKQLSKDLNNLNSVLLQSREYVISIVGLKCDEYNESGRNNSLDSKIKLLLERLLPDAVKYKDLFIQYFEVSSKKEININAPFYFVVNKLMENNVGLETSQIK